MTIFFLEKLCSIKYYTQHNVRFVKLTGTTKCLFLTQVVKVDVQPAQLRFMTKELDLAMVQQLTNDPYAYPIGT